MKQLAVYSDITHEKQYSFNNIERTVQNSISTFYPVADQLLPQNNKRYFY
jgi:hypothetical protein